jgi:hypothetical protein
VVLTDSHGISRAPCYLGSPSSRPRISTTGLPPSLVGHSRPFVYTQHVTVAMRQHDMKGPTTPHLQPLPGITQTRFSLIRVRSPLLTESLLFSLPVGTEMFHFPTFPQPALYIQAGVTRSPKGPGGVSPFGNPRITARLSTPRGLSQITTSFFGSRCQGIHRSLLKTCQSHELSNRSPEPEGPGKKLTSEHTKQTPPKGCRSGDSP